MRTLTLLVTTTSLLAALVLANPGCVTVPAGQGTIVPMQDVPVPIVGATRVGSSSPHPAGKVPDGEKGTPDPCATRLDDVVTSLYNYYALNQRLPDKLEDLASVADATTVLYLTCPVSGKPYIYNPVGLHAQDGDTLHLILYDATPAHNGCRWGVMFGPTPNRKGQVFYQMAVVRLTEKVFKSFEQVKAPLTQPAVEMPGAAPLSDQRGGTPTWQP